MGREERASGKVLYYSYKLYQFQKIFEELLREEKEEKPGAELFSRGLFLQLICLLYRSWKGQAMTELKSEKAALLDEIISYIEKHFAEEISLKTIAAHFLISESAIGQLFKKQMDVSFYKIVTQRRLIEAKKLIVHGSICEGVWNFAERVPNNGERRTV